MPPGSRPRPRRPCSLVPPCAMPSGNVRPGPGPRRRKPGKRWAGLILLESMPLRSPLGGGHAAICLKFALVGLASALCTPTLSLLLMNYLAFGNLFMVLRQRVQILTVRVTPLISMRRRCTFNTKRRRVRFCEKGTLLPCMGLRSHISQRPDIWIILSFFYYEPGSKVPPKRGEKRGRCKHPRPYASIP